MTPDFLFQATTCLYFLVLCTCPCLLYDTNIAIKCNLIFKGKMSSPILMRPTVPLTSQFNVNLQLCELKLGM